MSELKTLKDFEFPNMIWTKDNPKGLNGEKEMKKVLRQEAIKWIKYFRENEEIIEESDFKYFFNITEEDLK